MVDGSNDNSNPVLVEVTRGDRVESKHRGAVAVSDAMGRIKFSLGDIRSPIYPRSSIKAIQSLPLVESGAAEAFGYGAKELALACASHSGEERHVDVVQAMLDKAGVGIEDLTCGTHWPMGTTASRKLAQKGEKPSPIHNNCSGKHAGMIAAAIYLGMPLENYHDPDHPIQQMIREILESAAEVQLDRSKLGTDGCSVPNWAMPLHNLALAFAKFGSGTGISSKRRDAFLTLMDACRDEPELMGGSRRFCAKVLHALPNQVFLKGGAEGVYCGVLRDTGLGIALKIDDGARRAAELAMASVLVAFLPDAGLKLSPLTSVALNSWEGVQVGTVRPSAVFQRALDMVAEGVV